MNNELFIKNISKFQRNLKKMMLKRYIKITKQELFIQ
jgi:hypothetical protein